MTNPTIAALADLVEAALPWYRFLDYPRLPYTPEEAAELDRQEEEACTCHQQAA